MGVYTSIFEFYFLGLYLFYIGYFVIRKKWILISELISSTLFGISLEYLSIKTYDTYHYSEQFLIQLGSVPNNVPIVIGCCWGMILITCRSISNRIQLPNIIKVCIDVLLALTIDLAMDAMAIRIEGGFWNWPVPKYNQIRSDAFYGVIWPNFMGWIGIIFIYSSILRIYREKLIGRQKLIQFFYLLIMPILAYAPFYLYLEGINQIYVIYYSITSREINGFYFKVTTFLILLLIFTVIYGMVKYKPQIKKSFNLFSFLLFLGFHIYFIITYFMLGFLVEMPSYLIILIIVLVIDIAIHLLVTDFRTIDKLSLFDISEYQVVDEL